ncbi:PREDICTED: protein phosphatase 1 regulatory subunit 15A [Galeopterus variegatus]|uniref:Protein phosphatase 1 regulatory subunit 15A n=1 Tax=Galeopterus variegatus TaxID=482537 RepID=A0ABM0QGP0_GALVR|nr:PREDICTED: protein phosphatase 1 regulatory subunit 15A [Galeopterus variegatus]
MAPGQVPHQATPWRDVYPFFLLSPLMGFLGRAWSHLKGPGPPEPWLVETVIGEDQVEAVLEGEAKPPLVTHHAPWGSPPKGKAKDSGAAEEDGGAAWGACLNLKANSSPLEAWGLSDNNDEEYCKKEATSVPREQRSEFTDSHLASLSRSLLIKTLQDSDKNPGEVEAEEERVAEDKVVAKFPCPSSHWESCPMVEEREDGEAVKKEAPRTSSSPLSPGSKPNTWVYCPGEGEDRATEEERTENKEAWKTSITPSSSGSNPRAWEFCSGEEAKEKDEKAHKAAEKGEADPEPHSAAPAQRPLLRAWEYQPSKNAEKQDEEEDEDNALGAAEKEEGALGPSSIPPTSDFERAWVYWPGEDTEEDEDSDSGLAEEEGGAEASSSTRPRGGFLKAWVYQPGEDTEEEEDEEDSDSESAVEEAEASSSTRPRGGFLQAWVYRPGEDTEEEDDYDETEDKGDDSEAAEVEGADSDPHPSPQVQGALLRSWIYPPREEAEEEEAAEKRGEAEPSPFRVAIYLPGEKPPLPWAPPKLPLRLQRRLKFSETHTRDSDPETPLKARKVRFSEKVTVHFLAVWAGPAQAARRGPWEQLARDRSRFARRIARAQEELGPCLTPAARARAWARLGSPPPSLAPVLAATETLPCSYSPSTFPAQATPLSRAVATPSPPCLVASSGLSGRRG